MCWILKERGMTVILFLQFSGGTIVPDRDWALPGGSHPESRKDRMKTVRLGFPYREGKLGRMPYVKKNAS